ncbi:MAG: twitching motility protein PilT [Ignavibacteriales bacterium]|nr:twitching motility protein PilT [Ignavibacteriales bacterium]
MIHKAYFRFYEELNDFLPAEKRKIKFTHEFIDQTSIKDMIESLGVPHTQIDLILVNSCSVDFEYLVQDKDDISVYPVFESIDISGIQHLRNKPLREPKFILDVHLGKLARHLRMLGIDASYRNNFLKEELVNSSLEEKRTILTKDRNILKRNEITHGYWIRNDNPVEQVKEIILRFDLKNEIKEFTRCLECNNLLTEVHKSDIENELPPMVKEIQNEFFQCPVCKRIFWKGSHYKKMKALIKKFWN